MKYLVSILVLVFISLSVFSQNEVSSKNKKAIKAYFAGTDALEKYKYSDAETLFLSAISHDAKFVEAYIMLGTAYEEQKKYDLAIAQYEKSLEVDEDFFTNTFIICGRLQQKQGYYEDAKRNFSKLLTKKSIKPGIKAQAEQGIKQCDFAIEQVANPKPFEPKTLGSAINTSNNEYSPALTADESMIIFTRLIPSEYVPGRKQEDFYYSKKIGENWMQAEAMGKTLNSTDNEGAHTISPDGKIFYFTACNREGGKGSCDIYMSKLYKGGWDYPVNLMSINSGAWDSQPSIAPDGKTLFFSSARNGNMDIFVTTKDSEGKWSTPKPLSTVINTEHSEMAPFIHPDGKTLYFASDGHLGMGGLDIFISRKINDTTWSEPVNIGYPLNTSKDEAFLFVSASGKKAYFASDVNSANGMDIFSFDLYEDARPVAVTYLQGSVSDIETGRPLQANFELLSLQTGKLIASSVADDKGSFLLCIPTDTNYAININLDGYLFHSENFTINHSHSDLEPFVKNIKLQPIKNDVVVVLKNIFFDTDKYNLKDESFAELVKLTELLVNNPSLKIEIGGHTDNRGTKEHNRALSQNRAKSVYDYLLGKGISASRLSYKGYGDSNPIATNETEDGRQQNRRTEFKVISK